MSTAPAAEPRVNKKLLYALGAVAAAILVFVFVVNPLLLGGDEGDAVPLPVPAARPAPTDAAPPEADTVPDTDVPESLEVFSARDPFQQLVTGSGGSGEGSTPIAPPVRPAVQSDDSTISLSRVSVDGHGTPRAHLTVDGVSHQPAEGEQFAERLNLVDIADQCVTLLIEDQRSVLCAGEELHA